jgi:isopentenyldiphosphate isomerase
MINEAAPVKPDPEEAMDWKWMEVTTLVQDFKKHPDVYAPWLKIGLAKIMKNL